MKIQNYNRKCIPKQSETMKITELQLQLQIHTQILQSYRNTLQILIQINTSGIDVTVLPGWWKYSTCTWIIQPERKHKTTEGEKTPSQKGIQKGSMLTSSLEHCLGKNSKNFLRTHLNQNQSLSAMKVNMFPGTWKLEIRAKRKAFTHNQRNITALKRPLSTK